MMRYAVTTNTGVEVAAQWTGRTFQIVATPSSSVIIEWAKTLDHAVELFNKFIDKYTDKEQENMIDIAPHRSGWVDCEKVSIKGRNNYHRYNKRKMSKSSGDRLRQILNSERTSTTVEFEDECLTPTIYFQFYTVPVTIHKKVYQK